MVYVKRGISVLTFFMGLTIFLVILSFLFVPKNNMTEFGMEEVTANGILGEKENTIDVIVLGDSESYTSISPMHIFKETGYTAYVCGTSGQQLSYTTTMLHRAFEKQSPKIVIMETNAIFRKVSTVKAIVAKLSDFFSVFQYHNRWKSLNLNDIKGKVKFTWVNDFKGYQYYEGISSGVRKDYMKPTDEVAGIPHLNLKYIDKMKSFCDENGAQLVFLSTPSTKNWNYSRHNAIRQLADELSCEYVDLNLLPAEVPINWNRDTYDKGDHLNYSGAVKVTNFLSKYLGKTQLLTDHRSDPAYEKWHDSLKKYEADIAEKLK